MAESYAEKISHISAARQVLMDTTCLPPEICTVIEIEWRKERPYYKAVYEAESELHNGEELPITFRTVNHLTNPTHYIFGEPDEGEVVLFQSPIVPRTKTSVQERKRRSPKTVS